MYAVQAGTYTDIIIYKFNSLIKGAAFICARNVIKLHLIQIKTGPRFVKITALMSRRAGSQLRTNL